MIYSSFYFAILYIYHKERVYLCTYFTFFSAYEFHYLVGIHQFHTQSYHLHHFQHGFSCSIQENYFLHVIRISYLTLKFTISFFKPFVKNFPFRPFGNIDFHTPHKGKVILIMYLLVKSNDENNETFFEDHGQGDSHIAT